MNLDRAVQRAESVKGPKSAARLYADLEYELAMGEHDGDQEREGEQAIGILERRYPGVKAASDEVVENGHLPNISRAGKHSMDSHEGRRRRDTPAPAARQRVQEKRAQREGSNPRPNRASGILDADLPSIDVGGGGQLIAQFFAWGMGLSLLYLALTKSNAVGGLISGLANTTRAVVAVNVDPLNPHFNTATALAKQRATAATTAHNQAVTNAKNKVISGL